MADKNVRINFIADIAQLKAALKKASSSIGQFGKKTKKVGKEISTYISAPLALAGGIALKQAANFQKLQTTLDVLTGSAEEGAKAFERLVEFSAKTPFQLDQLVKANNTMMGFGLSADDAFNSLQQLGDIAAVSGGDLQRIAIAFGQSAAEGRVMSRDILQFINNGVPMYDLLADVTGKSAQEVRKLASEGRITFDVLQAAFAKATQDGGKFNGGMNILSKTLGGLFSTLRDNLNIAFAELGKEIAKAFNLAENIPKISKFLFDLTKRFKSLSPETKRFSIILAGIAVSIGPILLGLGTLLTLAPAIGSAFTVMMGPVGLVIAGLTAIAVIIAKNWKPIKKTLIDVTNYFIDLYNESYGFRILIESISAVFKLAVLKIKTQMRILYTIVSGVFKTILNLIGNFGTAVKGVFTLDTDLIKISVSEMTKSLKGGFDDIVAGVKNETNKAGEEAMQIIINGLKNLEGTKPKIKIETEIVTKKTETDSGGGKKTITPLVSGLKVFNDEEKIQQERGVMNRRNFLNDMFAVTTEGAKALNEGMDKLVKSAQKPFEVTNSSIAQFNIRTQEEIEKMTEIMNQAGSIVTGGFQAMAEGVGMALADAITNGGNLAQTLASVLLGAIGSMAIQLGQLAIKIGLAMKAIKMSFKKPGLAIAAGIALIAVGKMIQSAQSIVSGDGPKKFAKGGIVSTPTLGLFGEYPGARSNPEVVAPLDKLKNMIGEKGSSQVQVGGQFTLKGQDLVVALQRADRNRNRIK
jgi:tape measure domain-containing protein